MDRKSQLKMFTMDDAEQERAALLLGTSDVDNCKLQLSRYGDDIDRDLNNNNNNNNNTSEATKCIKSSHSLNSSTSPANTVCTGHELANSNKRRETSGQNKRTENRRILRAVHRLKQVEFNRQNNNGLTLELRQEEDELARQLLIDDLALSSSSDDSIGGGVQDEGATAVHAMQDSLATQLEHVENEDLPSVLKHDDHDRLSQDTEQGMFDAVHCVSGGDGLGPFDWFAFCPQEGVDMPTFGTHELLLTDDLATNSHNNLQGVSPIGNHQHAIDEIDELSRVRENIGTLTSELNNVDCIQHYSNSQNLENDSMALDSKMAVENVGGDKDSISSPNELFDDGNVQVEALEESFNSVLEFLERAGATYSSEKETSTQQVKNCGINDTGSKSKRKSKKGSGPKKNCRRQNRANRRRRRDRRSAALLHSDTEARRNDEDNDQYSISEHVDSVLDGQLHDGNNVKATFKHSNNDIAFTNDCSSGAQEKEVEEQTQQRMRELSTDRLNPNDDTDACVFKSSRSMHVVVPNDGTDHVASNQTCHWEDFRKNLDTRTYKLNKDVVLQMGKNMERCCNEMDYCVSKENLEVVGNDVVAGTDDRNVQVGEQSIHEVSFKSMVENSVCAKETKDDNKKKYKQEVANDRESVDINTQSRMNKMCNGPVRSTGRQNRANSTGKGENQHVHRCEDQNEVTRISDHMDTINDLLKNATEHSAFQRLQELNHDNLGGCTYMYNCAQSTDKSAHQDQEEDHESSLMNSLMESSPKQKQSICGKINEKQNQNDSFITKVIEGVIGMLHEEVSKYIDFRITKHIKKKMIKMDHGIQDNRERARNVRSKYNIDVENTESSGNTSEATESSGNNGDQTEFHGSIRAETESSGNTSEETESSGNNSHETESSGITSEETELLSTISKETESSGNNCDETESSGNISEETESSGNISEETESSGNNSDETESSGNNSDETESSGNNSEETESSGNNSEETESLSTISEEAESSGNNSDETESSGNISEETESSGNNSEETESSGNTSEETESSGNTSEETESSGNTTEETAARGDVGGGTAPSARKLVADRNEFAVRSSKAGDAKSPYRQGFESTKYLNDQSPNFVNACQRWRGPKTTNRINNRYHMNVGPRFLSRNSRGPCEQPEMRNSVSGSPSPHRPRWTDNKTPIKSKAYSATRHRNNLHPSKNQWLKPRCEPMPLCHSSYESSTVSHLQNKPASQFRVALNDPMTVLNASCGQYASPSFNMNTFPTVTTIPAAELVYLPQTAVIVSPVLGVAPVYVQYNPQHLQIDVGVQNTQSVEKGHQVLVPLAPPVSQLCYGDGYQQSGMYTHIPNNATAHHQHTSNVTPYVCSDIGSHTAGQDWTSVGDIYTPQSNHIEYMYTNDFVSSNVNYDVGCKNPLLSDWHGSDVCGGHSRYTYDYEPQMQEGRTSENTYGYCTLTNGNEYKSRESYHDNQSYNFVSHDIRHGNSESHPAITHVSSSGHCDTDYTTSSTDQAHNHHSDERFNRIEGHSFEQTTGSNEGNCQCDPGHNVIGSGRKNDHCVYLERNTGDRSIYGEEKQNQTITDTYELFSRERDHTIWTLDTIKRISSGGNNLQSDVSSDHYPGSPLAVPLNDSDCLQFGPDNQLISDGKPLATVGVHPELDDNITDLQFSELEARLMNMMGEEDDDNPVHSGSSDDIDCTQTSDATCVQN